MTRFSAPIAAAVFGLAAAGCGPTVAGADTPGGASPEASPQSRSGLQPTGSPSPEPGVRMETVVSGLNRPWGIAWLPDGSKLITERRGSIQLVSGGQMTPVTGGPEVFARGQGGLMDVALHPDFAKNNWVYFTYSAGDANANGTALGRGTLRGGRLEGFQQLFRVSQSKRGQQHFGSRILWLPDGTLLMSVGDGGNPPNSLDGENIRNQAQKPASHLGKILRLTAEGKPAPGNAWAGKGGAPEVWTIGHRNIQGLARDPGTGRIYASEHGARGGDEVNVVESGKNYGWPVATWSVEYSGPKISDSTSLPGMVDPIVVWTPCPAPSGLAFYTGDKNSAWRGDLFSGGLRSADVIRIDLDAQGRVAGQSRIEVGERVRDVRQGPDGHLYVLTDAANGSLIRLSRS